MHTQFCFGLGSMHFSEKKTIKNHISVGVEARKVEKI